MQFTWTWRLTAASLIGIIITTAIPALLGLGGSFAWTALSIVVGAAGGALADRYVVRRVLARGKVNLKINVKEARDPDAQ